MIRLFRAAGTVTSLMDRTRGRRHGFRVLETAREEIIRQAITSFYLKPTARRFRDCATRFKLEAGLRPPKWRTIKARVEDVDLQTRGAAAIQSTAILCLRRR
jgi:putative transposase